MCNNSFHAFFYFVFYTLKTTFFLQITLNCRENDLLLDRYKNGEEKNFDSRRSNKWYLEFVKEENNDSDDDLKDLVGEDVDMEVAYDYNMDRWFRRNTTWSWEPSKKLQRTRLMSERKIHDINSSLCEQNYTLIEVVNKLKIIKRVRKFQNKDPSTTGQ